MRQILFESLFCAEDLPEVHPQIHPGVFEGEIDIFVAMQQIVASHWLSNIFKFSLVYWSVKPEAKSPCASVMCRCKQTKTNANCQTKVANHTDVADIVVNSACFHGVFLIF